MTPSKTVVSIYACLMSWAIVLEVKPLQAQHESPNDVSPYQIGDLNGGSFRSLMPMAPQSGGSHPKSEPSNGGAWGGPGEAPEWEGEESQRDGEGEESEEEGEEGEEDEIETDRDSFTPATSIVGRGRTIFESAYSFIDNRSVAETHSVPEIVTRYGLTETIELRIGWNYEIGGVGSLISGNVAENHGASELEEESKLLYGAKFFLTRQNGWTPRSSLIVQGYTPTFGESNLSTVSADYVFGWKLKNGWIWDTATRFGTSGTPETPFSSSERFNTWSPSTVIKVPLGERSKAHIEYFGVFTEGREEETSQNFISPGVNYLINQDLEVGIRVAWGLNEQSPEFISNVGFGWRF